MKQIGESYASPEDVISTADKAEVKAFASWFRASFRLDTAKTPKGQKDLKQDAQAFLDLLERTADFPAIKAMSVHSIVASWEMRRLDGREDDLVRFFSAEGDADRGKAEAVVEIRGQYATYYNRANIGEKTFRLCVAAYDKLFASIRGWRAKALKGELKVAFVGTQQMTVKGKYRQNIDEMWVKATPSILKVDRFIEYIVVHELGHRYEKFNRLPTDFDKVEWHTSKYSYNEGEAFAELFAIGHFNLPQWKDKIEKFESVMSHS